MGMEGHEHSFRILQCASWNVQEDSSDLHIGSVNVHSPSGRNVLALGEGGKRLGVWLLM